jgi:hypothetical protein
MDMSALELAEARPVGSGVLTLVYHPKKDGGPQASS